MSEAFRALALHRSLAQAFDSIPEAKFSYKPTPFTFCRLTQVYPQLHQLFMTTV